MSGDWALRMNLEMATTSTSSSTAVGFHLRKSVISSSITWAQHWRRITLGMSSSWTVMIRGQQFRTGKKWWVNGTDMEGNCGRSWEFVLCFVTEVSKKKNFFFFFKLRHIGTLDWFTLPYLRSCLYSLCFFFILVFAFSILSIYLLCYYFFSIFFYVLIFSFLFQVFFYFLHQYRVRSSPTTKHFEMSFNLFLFCHVL